MDRSVPFYLKDNNEDKAMKNEQVNQIAKASYNNHAALAAADRCGCYFCQKIFPTTEVTQWVDQQRTGICPYCGMDTLLTNTQDIKPLALRRIYKMMFRPWSP